MREAPDAILRAAATRISEHAGYLELGSVRGPWSVHAGPTGYPQSVNNVGVPIHICDTFTDPQHPPTVAHWIALMHPGIAEPIARLMSEVAGDIEVEGQYWQATATTEAVLDIARVILGGKETSDGA